MVPSIGVPSFGFREGFLKLKITRSAGGGRKCWEFTKCEFRVFDRFGGI
jgi:hypothetical protein